ncbi:MAG: O-antigen ligase family protein [Chloroflexi bacterium]|nr:O-antigen ligase family protein [Chloroflexota bacterium]
MPLPASPCPHVPASEQASWLPGAVLAATLCLIPNATRWVVVAPPGGDPRLVFPEFAGHVLYASDLALAALAGALVVQVLRGVLRQAQDERDVLTGPVFLLGLVAAWSFASALWAEAPARAVEAGLRWSEAVVLALALAVGLLSVRHISWTLGLSAGLQGWIALGQFLRQGSLGLDVLGELHLGPLNPNVARWPLEAHLQLLFGYGLSPHPYVLAGYLLLGLGALWGLRHAGEPLREPVWTLALLGASLGLLATFSRAAWLAVVVMAGAALLLGARPRSAIRHWRPLLLPAAGLALAAALLLSSSSLGVLLWARLSLLVPFVADVAEAPGDLLSRGFALLNPSGRPALAWMALHLWLERPLLGIGGGNFALAALARWPAFTDPFLPVHNVWLLATSELGPLGLGLAVALAVAPLAGWVARRGGHQPWLVTWTVLWCGFLVVWTFDYYPWEGQHGRLLMATVLGLWMAAAREGVRDRRSAPKLQAQGGVFQGCGSTCGDGS